MDNKPEKPSQLEIDLVKMEPWDKIESELVMTSPDTGYENIVLTNHSGKVLKAIWPGEIKRLTTLCPNGKAIIQIEHSLYDKVKEYQKWTRKNAAEIRQYQILKAKYGD